MSVVCATNLTQPAVGAATVAAAIAARLGEPLCLVGVRDVEHLSPELPSSRAEARQRLEAEASRLRVSFGATVETHLLQGSPSWLLVGDERCQHSRLMVLSADGWGPSSSWRRVPLYERVASHSLVPVLVVRGEGRSLTEWALGHRHLVVLAGVDDSSTGRAAAAWLHELRRIGPCDVVVANVCSPAEERQRLGIHTPAHVALLEPAVRRMEVLDPQVERVLLREMRERVGELPGEGSVELLLEPGFGRPADHLLHVAKAREVDLVVVGTHQRAGLSRLWHGSVSANVLRHAEQSVACVPPSWAVSQRPAPPRSVLVPVDFSDASHLAISQARSLVRPGGRVHLLHVHRRRATELGWLDHYGVLPEPPSERAQVLHRLEDLVARESGGGQVEWTVEGVTGDDVAQAICQATEREGVDLVCLGTSDAPGHFGYLDDAVARELVERCRRPVMVLHA